ncbi:hypothetical protein INT45_008605 [Circinella minor]|uniref:Uncharacterized protein n=1 Tax=Circinella minor TaxID=1195481 RepID=A0A8H7VM80_9FUNG|nr:hypothetical protein INT45_008605 [Circinella minor]
MFLPSSINELGIFKDRLEASVIWHNFMEDQIKIIENAELRSNLVSATINLYNDEDEDDTTALPTIFFTPKHKQPKKTSIW